ncbi:MAG: hypothetical protein AMXMBFR84_37230 [Candidatus Hydrogenedentota bacterium]
MSLIGILISVVGLLGAVGTFAGIIQIPGVAGDPKLWAAVLAVGVVVTILTRRPGD